MLKNKKGFSLTVLVIAIAVIIIITATAVISIRSITKERSISEFMTDLADVKQYAIEYFNRDGTLPIKEGMGSAETSLLHVLASGEALYQIAPEDTGDYYFVDIAKLGKIHLTDENRGYVINEGTLNVYITTPLEYQGIKYYTLTSDLLGKTNIVNASVPFEVTITGIPVTWSDKAELLVYVPNEKITEDSGWNFRWLKGSHSIDDFKTVETVNYFNYGETISLFENGIYTINVENPNGKALVRKVVITKIDDISPTVIMKNGEIIIDDAQTGVKNIYYKIRGTKNFEISESARTANPKYYTSADEDPNDTNEEKCKKYLGAQKNKGDKIDNYLNEYHDYYTQYMNYDSIISDDNSTMKEITNAQESLKMLNSSYPQFAYANRPFSNIERNIVIYVEDMAGNGSTYSAMTRSELNTLKYTSSNEKTMADANVIINNNNLYTNNRNISLYIKAMYGKYFFVSENPNPSGTFNYFYSNRVQYPVTSEGDGLKTIYVFFEDEAKKRIRVFEEVFIDETSPSQDAPTVTGTVSNLTIKVNQTDSYISDGIETQSGLTDNFKYGIKEASSTGEYRWYKRASDIPTLEIGKTYLIITEATDKAGNSIPSNPTTFKDDGTSGE